jgi:hypothetical protein
MRIPKIVALGAGCIFLFIINNSSYAQLKPLTYRIGIQTDFAVKGNLPFWLYTDRFGIIDQNSNNLLGDFKVQSDYSFSQKWDYSYGAELIGRASDRSGLYLNQLYFKAHYGPLQLQIGRMRERLNTHMPGLSSGSIMWSGNATPLPKIVLSFPHYTPIPFTHGYLKIKGYWGNGWFEDSRYVKDAYLQQKQLYFQAGGNLPVNAYIGLTDDVQWGGTSSNANVGRLPQGIKDYIKAFFGAHGGSNSPRGEEINALGNHIGSWELGATWDFGKYKGIIYRQTIFEDKSGLRLGQGSIRDGLLGVGIQTQNRKKVINGVLWEFLYTKNQSGPAATDPPKILPPGATPTRNAQGYPWGGRDNYFNNYIYRYGWTYYGMTIGTPFITPLNKRTSINENSIINNRVVVQHFGIQGLLFSSMSYRAFFTYSRNYGTYYTPYTPHKTQYSVYYEMNIPVKSVPDLEINTAVSGDFGNMYGTNYGFMIGLTYSGLFKKL